MIDFEEIVLFLSQGKRIGDLPLDVQVYIHENLSYEDQLTLGMISDGNADDSESEAEGGDEE